MPAVEKQKLLAFVSKKLALTAADVEQVNPSAALVFFSAQLGKFVEDGIITDEELIRLEEISRFANR